MVVGFERIGKTTLLNGLFPFTVTVFREPPSFGESKTALLKIQGKVFSLFDPESTILSFQAIVTSDQWVMRTDITSFQISLLSESDNRRENIYTADADAFQDLAAVLRSFLESTSTHGIDIRSSSIDTKEVREDIEQLIESRREGNEGSRRWSAEEMEKMKLELSVWDFAGQHDYYNNHHYFLRSRAIYLVVWSMNEAGGKGMESLKFWFKSLMMHLGTGESENHSVVVVGTRLDELDLRKISRSLAESREKKVRQIANQFGIASILYFEVSSHTLEGMDDLRKTVFKKALSHNYMGEIVPQSYLCVEVALRDLLRQYSDAPLIELERVVEYCEMTWPVHFSKEEARKDKNTWLFWTHDS